jgi:hypothetical protein
MWIRNGLSLAPPGHLHSNSSSQRQQQQQRRQQQAIARSYGSSSSSNPQQQVLHLCQLPQLHLCQLLQLLLLLLPPDSVSRKLLLRICCSWVKLDQATPLTAPELVSLAAAPLLSSSSSSR